MSVVGVLNIIFNMLFNANCHVLGSFASLILDR